MHIQPTNNQGYTLLELMIVITIMAVLATLAYPSFLNWLYGMEAKRVQRTLQQALLSSRMHSASTRQTLTVCLSDEQDRCQRNGSKSVLVFVDNNNNGHMDAAELIDRHPLNIKYGTLQSNWSLHRNHIKYFGNTGMPRGHFGNIRYCSPSNKPAHSFRIIMSQQGHVRAESGC